MTSLLPKNLQDISFLALEECAKKAFDIDKKEFMTILIEYLSDEILRELSEQFHIKKEGWNDCKNRDEQIALLKNAVNLHKKKGTIGAIENILQLNSEIAEYTPWYKYNGIPHHFIIDKYYYDTGIDILSDYEKLKTRLDNSKQLRAKLDGINFYIAANKDYYLSDVVMVGETITVDFGGANG